MGRTRTAIALYRALLRWGWQHADVPFPLQATHVVNALPNVQLHRHLDEPMTEVDAAVAVKLLTKLGFRETAFWEGEGEREREDQGRGREHALDRGINARRLLNTRYHSTMESMRELRHEHLHSKSRYPIGHVFKHRKFGYRGVIYGFDARCDRDAEWQAQMGVTNPEQPFYYVLPDAADCVRLFGGPRLTKYVAEDNIDEVDETDVGKGIQHQALPNYFQAWSPSSRRYKPNKRLSYEYAQDDDDDDDNEQHADLVSL